MLRCTFLPASNEGGRDNFFEYLDFALRFIPPSPDATAVRAECAKIGVGPEKTFYFKDLSPENKTAAADEGG